MALAIAGRELLAIRRLARIDAVQREAAAALASGSARAARGGGGTARARSTPGARGCAGAAARLAERQAEVFDADGLLRLAEAELLAPLDAAGRARGAGGGAAGGGGDGGGAAAARRRGGGAGGEPAHDPAGGRDLWRAVGRRSESWRLVRHVMTHLVATGAVAVGDDLLHGVAGGTVLSRLSRRFGEGVVNGALTARVGIAAIEVCRPLPFLGREGPSVTGILGGALQGAVRAE